MSAVSAEFTLAAGDFRLAASLDLEAGVLVLFGPSGAGKTLTLHALAGLHRPLTGTIRVGGETLFDAAARIDVPAHRRGLGWVPQQHVLFPFLTVAENVAFGLPRKRRKPDDAEVVALMDELGLTRLAGARPESLSGGERQRVALARALATRPRLLLLDEPFASLDQSSRLALRAILRATLARHATSAIFVTHDADEAIAVGDRLIRYERGRTVESGVPATILAPRQTTLAGKVAAVHDLADGRRELQLEATTLTGPRELLPHTPGDAVNLAVTPSVKSPKS